MRTKFWLEILKRTEHPEDVRVDGRKKLKWRVWTGFIWLRIVTGSELL
jgi:hypothetical protein